MAAPDLRIVTTPKNVALDDDTLIPESPGISVEEPVSDIQEAAASGRTKMLPDGGAVITMDDENLDALERPVSDMLPFEINLADVMDEGDMTAMAMDLVQLYEADKRSRSDWEKTYKDGLPLLGFKIETRTEPWPNACGVVHPVMTEAAVRFLASAMTESFPARGPVKSIVIGKWTRDKEKKAHRVQDELNYQLTEVMKEYRAETEQVIWRMCIGGSAFRKIYFDPILNRPTAVCVGPENLVVPYGATHFETCERFTHELFYTDNQIESLQTSGYFRAVDIGSAGPVMQTQIDTAKDKISGMSPTIEVDTRHEILEMHVDMTLKDIADGGGIPCPYIITIDKATSTVLSIYRNWKQEDEMRAKRVIFVHYQYMPGFGFYGLGLINLLGGLTKAATSILRQCVDAGTLANLRAGYKTRGLRIKGDNRPLEPGEMRDIDVLSGTLRDNIYFPDFKGPSAELAQLMGTIVEEARRLGSVADMKVSEVSGEMPVGTILAIFERNMKVQNAIQARLHSSLKEEFKLISELVSEHSARYDYEIDGDPAIKKEDFDPKIISIIPVSDPNASTLSQRMLQHQAVMQMSASAPQLYDMPELHRRALDIMGVKDPDKIIPDKTNIQPTDPVSENMSIMNLQPVKAGLEQDHESHIKIHLAFSEDPSIQALLMKNPAVASQIAAAMSAHIQDHVAMEYRKQIEKQLGIALPPPGQPLPPEIEYNFSRAIADAAEAVLEESKSKIAQKKAEESLKDPVIQLQQDEIEIKKTDLQRKIAKDEADTDMKLKQLSVKSLLDLARQASTERSFKADHVADSVQSKAEAALKGNAQMFDLHKHQSSLGAKVLDSLLKQNSQKPGGDA